MKLAYVEWLDASYQEGPLCEDDFEPRVVLVSAGLLAREVIVYIPELDVEENGIRIVTKYLDTTYGEPFPLLTDPSRGDIKEQRWEYELLYVE